MDKEICKLYYRDYKLSIGGDWIIEFKSNVMNFIINGEQMDLLSLCELLKRGNIRLVKIDFNLVKCKREDCLREVKEIGEVCLVCEKIEFEVEKDNEADDKDLRRLRKI